MSRSTSAAGAVAVALMLVAPTACGGGGGNRTQASGCTLHILGETRSSSAEADAWNKVFADFKTAYHCTVTATWQGQYTDVPQQLNEAELAGQKVDLVTASTENYSVAKAGKVMDLTKLVSRYADRFQPNALNDFTLGGHLFAVPFSLQSSSVFFYNATLFKRLGLSTPTTYAQLVNVANTIKQKTNVQPVTEGGKDSWEWPMWYMQTFAQTSGNKSIPQTKAFLEGKAKFTDPAEVAALAKVAQFGASGLLTQNDLATTDAGAQAAFLKQKAAMLFDGTWSLPVFREAKPAFKIGVFRFPLVVATPGVTSQPSGATEGGLSIPTAIPKPDLPMAAQFLEFITRRKQANEIIGTLDATVPPIKSVAPAKDPLAPVLSKTFAPDTILWLDWIWPNDVNNAVISAIEGVLYNHQTPQDAAQTVQAALDTLRSQQTYVYDWWDTWTSTQWEKVTPPSLPKIDVKN